MASRATIKAKPTTRQHERVMRKLRAMNRVERIQTLVDAGILTETLELDDIYVTEPVLSYRAGVAE